MKKERFVFGRVGIIVLIAMILSVMGIFSVSASAKMKINKKNATINVGHTVKLKVKNANKKVKWKSSKASVASVSKKGLVKGKKAGKATITAKVGRKKYKCKVTVNSTKKGGTVVAEVRDKVKDSIVNTVTTYGKTDTDSDGFHYYLEYTDYDYDYDYDELTEYYTTVLYYPNTGIVKISMMTDRVQLVYFDIVNSNDGSCYIVFYDDIYEDYGKGYLYKSLINNSSAVSFDIDTYEDNVTRSIAEKLTTSSAKLALMYFDDIMREHGSTIRHKDLGFYF